MSAPWPPDPFAVLGLPPDPMLTDQQVRGAWQAIARATHPDREDGGNPAGYAAASAAFGALRGPWSRTEAYADLVASGRVRPAIPAAPGTRDEPGTVPMPAVPPVPAGPPAVPPPAAPARRPALAVLPARLARGRPAVLAARVLAAAAASAAAWYSGAGTPAVAGVIALAVTWLALAGRRDLAPPPGR